MPNPLALEHTLRDLAILRASDVTLGHLLPTRQPGGDSHDKSVHDAAEFIRAGRETVRTMHRGVVEGEGARLEGARGQLEEVLAGLD
ncbi:hypothetical protein EXIGLDRAFT_730169 [Exidia glandulosa HHB12029]|uniref:Uncharacterized protein n=1 Tax=Exidia glandulosa HHB12029 TaxID=1314781 RepID=A0A165CAX8_EXIGL|nr:hypothetical protein EXIGLDRAFT_730169 [Exidia glandulosa HHB12029]